MYSASGKGVNEVREITRQTSAGKLQARVSYGGERLKWCACITLDERIIDSFTGYDSCALANQTAARIVREGI